MTAIVRAEEVVKTFGGTIKALDGVSIEFEPGIIYGLLGPNGAGKTTLIRVLTTLVRPDSGMAMVAGIDVLTNPVTARTKIGLAGQSAAVDPYLTGRENVEMVASLYGLSQTDTKRRTNDLLERIKLADAAERQVRTYSGGMRRRLDLAASMVGRPEVLFLDEPTTGIDPRSRIDMWELIEDLVEEGTTILLTTQYLDEADRLASYIGIIDHGRLITEGTTNELKDRLGGSVVAVKVEPGHNDGLCRILRDVSGGEEPIHDPVRDELHIPAQGANTLTEVVRRLDAAGIVPEDIGFRKPTLDDVFLSLTGHTTEDGDSEIANPRTQEGRRT